MRLKTVTRHIAHDFEAVETSVLSVEITVGAPFSGIELSAEEHVIDKIETSVMGKVLRLIPSPSESFSTESPIRLKLSMEQLTYLRASAGATVEIKNAVGHRLEIEAESGARVVANGSTDDLITTSSSGATIDVLGMQYSEHSVQTQSGGAVKS